MIVEGEQDEAEVLLSKDATLALEPRDIIDLAGRFFKGITGLQYAIWALDWHMWSMILKYLPNEKAVEQIKAMESGSWISEHRKSGDWLVQNLLDALHVQISLLKQSKFDEAKTQWRTKVGGAQYLLPIPFINEYCHPNQSFEPCPDFTQPTLPRSRKMNKGEWFTTTYHHGKLGTKFAICRGFHDRAEVRSGKKHGHRVQIAKIDYKACQMLLATRVQQREQLFTDVQLKKSFFVKEPQHIRLTSKSAPKPLIYSFKPKPHVHISTPKPFRIEKEKLPKATATFLKMVYEGKQDRAEVMLQKDVTLATLSSDITDLSGRTFKGITGLQYAIWGLDWHMWTMILKYLPKDKAIEQINAMDKGLWVTEHGKSGDWLVKNFLNAMQTQINLLMRKKWDIAEAHWQKNVGGAQYLLPISFINEYCHPNRPFYPCPDFTQTPLPRSCLIDESEWFKAIDNGGKLGDKFAVLRYSWPSGGLCTIAPSDVEVLEADHEAVSVLLTTRLQQREVLKALDNFPKLGF